MSYWLKLPAIKLLLLSTGLLAGSAWGQPVNPAAEGLKCSKIQDRVQRLLCFDAAFKTPVEQAAVMNIPHKTEKPDGPLRIMAKTLENQRVAGDPNWIMRARPWQQNMLLTQEDYEKILTSPANRQPEDENSIKHEWTAQTVDIFMTMKEADTAPEPATTDMATMMLSCENDITTLAVLLPEPIKTLQANLSLSSGNDSLFRLNWRDVENGTVVIAGRGLESIDTIKTIANYSRVQLQVNYPEETRAFVFDMNDLKDRLTPLRTACHW